MQNQTLTKSEMTVMNILWEMPDGGTVYDVLEKYEEPKPAYTTISGRTYTYFPLISKNEYSRRAIQEVKKDLFDGSAKSLLSFFVQNEGLSADDIKELLQLIKE